MDCQTVPSGSTCTLALPGLECAEGAEVRDHVAGCELCCHAVRRCSRVRWSSQSLAGRCCIPAGCETGFWLRSSFPPREWSLQGGHPESGSVGCSDSGLSIMLALGGWYWATRAASMTLAKWWRFSRVVLLVRSRLRWRSTAVYYSLRSPILAGSESPPPACGLGFGWTTGHDVAAFRVNIASLRFRGWLVVIPVSRVSDAPAHSDPIRPEFMPVPQFGRIRNLCTFASQKQAVLRT